MRMPNNIFTNWNKVCYIRKRVTDDTDNSDEYGNETEKYNSPKKYIINYQPVTNDAEKATLKEYGISLEGTVKALVDYKYNGEFNKYDLAYLYDKTPENEKYDGEFANYRVVTAIPQNMKILVYFERLIKS